MILIQLGFRKLRNKQTLPWQVKKKIILPTYWFKLVGYVNSNVTGKIPMIHLSLRTNSSARVTISHSKIDNEYIFLLTQNRAKIDQLELWYNRDSFKIVLYLLMSGLQ